MLASGCIRLQDAEQGKLLELAAVVPFQNEEKSLWCLVLS